MHAGFGSQHIQRRPKLFVKALNERGSALAVEHPHPTNVPCEMPFIHEIREYRLEKVRRSNIHRVADCCKAIEKVWRNNDIAEPQRGEKSLAKGSDIDDSGVMVKSL
jgi:hypothetical protein